MQIKNPITLHVQSPRTLQQRLGFIGAWIQREETQQHLYCSDVAFNKSHGMMCISIEIWLYHKRSVGLVSYVCTRQHLASSQQFNPHNNMNKDDIDSTFEGCSLCFIHIHVQICVFLRSLICDVLSPCGKHKFPLLRLKLIHKLLVVKYYWLSATPRVVHYYCCESRNAATYNALIRWCVRVNHLTKRYSRQSTSCNLIKYDDRLLFNGSYL